LTGQKRIMPGAGKQRHVGLQRDKEMQEKLLQQERERARQTEEILNQIEKVLKLLWKYQDILAEQRKGDTVCSAKCRKTGGFY